MQSSNASIHQKSEDDARGNVQGWLQVEKKAHRAMALFGAKNGTALAVLHLLTARLNRGTNAVIMSHEAIASALSITSRTAKDSTKKLEAAKFIQVLKSGTSNVYVINSRVAWQGVRGMRHAAFNAELVVVEQEQVRSVDEMIEESKHLEHVPILDLDERLIFGNENLPPPDQQEMDLP
jgi:hypothetical protein